MTADLEQRKRDLRQKQSLPLEGKIILAEQRIREWYDHWAGDVYISFSGGKDSTVLLDLVKGLYPDVPAVFVDTGLEYPEVRRFATERADVVLRPEMRFDQVVKKYGYPVIGKMQARFIRDLQNESPKNQATVRLRRTGINRKGEYCPMQKLSAAYLRIADAPFKVSEQCCDVMKKEPFHRYEKKTGRKPFVGVMTQESKAREKAWLDQGCNAFNQEHPQSRPLSIWTEQDVLQYIKRKGLEIASVYGDIVEADQIPGQMRFPPDLMDKLTTTGESRTGCMFCMFGAQCEKAPNRFQRMKETHPRQYAYCMKSVEEGGLGLREVLEYIGIPYE